MRKILVTGGAGFIGSNFTRFMLNRYPDYHLVVLDALTYAGNPENLYPELQKNGRLTFWYGNVRNPEIVHELVSQVDTVVHFAAESHVARSIYDNVVFYETDVLGTQVVANAVLKHPNVERLIHISTSEVYGTALQAPMTEEHPLNPMSPYASAKAGADRLVYSYVQTYNIPAVIVRPFNNYGPYQHLEKAVPRFITSALRNEPLTVHGDGRCSRDWLYVEDHCEALDKLLHVPIEQVRGEVINIGTGTDIPVEHVARTILEVMEKPLSLIQHIGDRPGQVQRHIASTDKALKLLGWRAGTSFAEGIQRTVEWYRCNPQWWEKLSYMRSVPIKTKSGTVEYH